MKIKFFNRESQKVFGLNISAIFEIGFFLVVVTFFNLFFGDGTRYREMNLHPFWIIILLVSVQYGTAEGILAVILSTLFLYVQNFPEQKPDESFFEYQLNVALLPSLWFITAFVLGEIRNRVETENRRLKSSYDQAKSEVEKISAEYLVLKEANENLEFHLSSQQETAATTFKIFKALEGLEPAQVIFGLNDIIEKTLNPEQFSIFAKGPNGLEAVTSKGWKSNDRYGRRFIPSSPLFKAIVNEHKLLSVVNKTDRTLLGNEGVLATPLIEPDTGEVFGMLKIEKADFHFMSLSHIETFRVIGELIGRSYSSAKKHHLSQQNNIFAIPDKLYSLAIYKEFSKYLNGIGKPTVIIPIQLNRGGAFSENQIMFLQSLLPSNMKCFDADKKLRELLLMGIDQIGYRDKIHEISKIFYDEFKEEIKSLDTCIL